MEYHGDLVRHSLLNDWYEVGTKFERNSMIVVRNFTNLVRNTIPSDQIQILSEQIHLRRYTPPGSVFGHKGPYSITSGVYFVPSS